MWPAKRTTRDARAAFERGREGGERGEWAHSQVPRTSGLAKTWHLCIAPFLRSFASLVVILQTHRQQMRVLEAISCLLILETRLSRPA